MLYLAQVSFKEINLLFCSSSNSAIGGGGGGVVEVVLACKDEDYFWIFFLRLLPLFPLMLLLFPFLPLHSWAACSEVYFCQCT